MSWSFWIFIIAYFWYDLVLAHERIPPGISPQHYQQPPPPHHGQGIHQVHQSHIPYTNLPHQTDHQQLIQQNQQQIPQMQQIPQTQVPPIQHVPVQQNAGHDYVQVLNAANIAHEKEHISEHLDVPIDTNKMTEQELQFHYFKMHDSDNNNKLDGCELIKSLIHWHEEGSKEPNGSINEKIFTDEELIALIDPILTMDDKNNDGFIDYPEFIHAQQKAASVTTHQ